MRDRGPVETAAPGEAGRRSFSPWGMGQACIFTTKRRLKILMDGWLYVTPFVEFVPLPPEIEVFMSGFKRDPEFSYLISAGPGPIHILVDVE